MTDSGKEVVRCTGNGFAELRLREAPAVYGPRIFRCIVWDLDHTLWEGSLAADGADGVAVRAAAMDAIEETDRRGILHSIAGRNDYHEAMAVLRRLGLEDYFLFPQITRRRKSESIRRIADLLHIPLDTIAFVDDEANELAEVQAGAPGVTVIDAAECMGIAGRPECMVPHSGEGAYLRHPMRQRGPRIADAESAIPLACQSLIQCVLDFDDRPARRSLHQRPCPRTREYRVGV